MLAFPSLVLAPAFAEDGEDDAKAIYDENDADVAQEEPEGKKSTPELTEGEGDGANEIENKVESLIKDEDGVNEIENKVESLIKDESELDVEVTREVSDEKKSIQDEKRLIDELEKEIALASGAEEDDRSGTAQDELDAEANAVRADTEALIEEEEELKTETEEILQKIAKMETEVRSLDDADATPTSEKTTSEAFVEKLQQRVEREEDLIARLKRQSEKDVDPSTGKFKVMTAREYKERTRATDVDFLKFLKDTVANEEEWERDLEAFEGFLRREFGPTVDELGKDLKPLASEVERDLKPLLEDAEAEVRRGVASAMSQLKEKASLATGSETEDLRQRADGLVSKLRSMF